MVLLQTSLNKRKQIKIEKTELHFYQLDKLNKNGECCEFSPLSTNFGNNIPPQQKIIIRAA